MEKNLLISLILNDRSPLSTTSSGLKFRDVAREYGIAETRKMLILQSTPIGRDDRRATHIFLRGE